MNREDVQERLDGVLPAAVTPRTADMRIDTEGLAGNLRAWRAFGFSGYLILGSTGELPLLSDAERMVVIETARGEIPPDQLLLVGTGQQGTAETIAFTQRAAEAGADAALVVTPNYYSRGLTVEALTHHYTAVADASPIPVLLYSVPPLTGFALPPAVAADLATHPNIIGIKDSSGQPGSLLTIRAHTPPEFKILNGSAIYSLGALVDGAADGLILAMANVAPEWCIGIHRAVRNNDLERARRLHRRLLILNEAISPHGIGGYKAAMEARGWAGGPPTSPLQPASGEERAMIDKALREAELTPS